MLRKKRTRVALLSVIALAVVAMASVSAQAWDPAGTYAIGDGTETLTSTVGAPGGPTLTCVTEFDADLEAGVWNRGEVTNADISNCVSSNAGCTVSVVDNDTPWEIAGQRTNVDGDGWVSVDHASYTATYTNTPGQMCQIGTGSITVQGSVTGNYDSGTGSLSFGTGLDTLEITASTLAAAPVGTDVDLSDDVTVQGTPKPVLQG